MFKLEIETDTAAFIEDGEGAEIARILRQLAGRLSSFASEREVEFGLLDSNGNRIGSAIWTKSA